VKRNGLAMLSFARRSGAIIVTAYATSILIASPDFAGHRKSNDPYRVGAWAVMNGSDPITDKPVVKVQTPLDSRKGPYLVLSCEGGKPFLAFGIPGISLKAQETLSLNLRIDKGEPTQARLQAFGLDFVAARLTQATYLSTARLIAVYISRDPENNGDGWQLQFPVSRSAEAFRPMLAECPIESAEQAAPEKYDPEQSKNAQAKPADDPVETKK
jgi:hypothetical protein